MSPADNTTDKSLIHLAQLPHQLFLFNTIGNHVLLTVITISVAMSNPYLTLIIPIVSVATILYTLLRAPAMARHNSLLVRAHWGVAVFRTKILLIAYGVLATAATASWLMFAYGNAMKELMFALVGGLGLLPFMVTVLTLTIMESDTLHHATNGHVADNLRRRYGTEEEQAEAPENTTPTTTAAPQN